jgi:hypothetical protein
MVLGLAQPLTELSTRNLPGSIGLPARKADNLTAICEQIVILCNISLWVFLFVSALFLAYY